VRLHQTTRQRPVDRFQEERGVLRPLSAVAFPADEAVSVVVNSHARVCFDGNRYSAPPELARKTVLLRASGTWVRVLEQGREMAIDGKSYRNPESNQTWPWPQHRCEACPTIVRHASTVCENGEAFPGRTPRRAAFKNQSLIWYFPWAGCSITMIISRPTTAHSWPPRTRWTTGLVCR